VTGTGTVAFGVVPEVAFDYLADPRHRPAWQSSLARVDGVTGEPHAGQTWTDVTRPGLRPAMETTSFERPHRWAERGRWRGFEAGLTLTITPTDGGCSVGFEFAVTGRGVLRPVGAVLTAAAVPAVRADLRRAADILSPRS
jgi:hypothetical protein